MRRVVLDPNVFISALIAPKGASARVLDAWLSGVCDSVASPELLAELERVLMRPKFRPYFSETEVRAYLRLIQATALQTADPARTESARADCLVSGDKHLLGLERIGLNVLSPAAFLELLKL